MLENNFVVLSAFGNCCSAGVSLLIRCNLDTIVNFVFADIKGHIVVADVAIKSFTFRMIAVYSPNINGERRSLF